MASNRAIMPRAAVASHQLPDDVEGHADTRSATARPPQLQGSAAVPAPFPQREMASTATQACRLGQQRRPRHQVRRRPAAGVNGPCELEGWNPKLKLIREILLTREPRLPNIRPPLASTPDFSRQAQPCPGRGRSSCITASTTWAQSERGHPSRVMTGSSRLRDCALIGAGAIPRRGHDYQHAIPR
jgi:hypothetical protein